MHDGVYIKSNIGAHTRNIGKIWEVTKIPKQRWGCRRSDLPDGGSVLPLTAATLRRTQSIVSSSKPHSHLLHIVFFHLSHSFITARPPTITPPGPHSHQNIPFRRLKPNSNMRACSPFAFCRRKACGRFWLSSWIMSVSRQWSCSDWTELREEARGRTEVWSRGQNLRSSEPTEWGWTKQRPSPIRSTVSPPKIPR